jgi:hypothetical protein
MDLTRHAVRWLVGVDSLPLQLLALLVEDCASWGVISYGFPDWYWWMLHGWEAPFLPAFWRSMSIHPVVFRFRYANEQNLAVVPQGGNTGQLLVMIGQVTDLDIIWVSAYLRKLFFIYIPSSNQFSLSCPFGFFWRLTLHFWRMVQKLFTVSQRTLVVNFKCNFPNLWLIWFPILPSLYSHIFHSHISYNPDRKSHILS